MSNERVTCAAPARPDSERDDALELGREAIQTALHAPKTALARDAAASATRWRALARSPGTISAARELRVVSEQIGASKLATR